MSTPPPPQPPPPPPPYMPPQPPWGVPSPAPKWYHSDTAVVIALLFCFPIGLFWVWGHPRYTAKTKVVITVVVAACIVLGVDGIAGLADDVTTRETTHDTATTEATTTLPSTPTPPPPPESVTLSSGGQQATAPFHLEGGRYTVHYRFGGNCYYGADLESTSADASVHEDVGTGMGPVEGDTNIYGIESGEYYVDMITGPVPDCPWEIVLTAAE
jgi:hypothetical protein